MATIQTAIKQYLDNRAATDELFAAKYNNPKKSIQECCQYITGEAYARAEGGTAVISDEEVYGWAVHYYDKDKQGRRIETVEVNTKTFQVVQSRGVCNQNTPYHNEIINLVNNNMYRIRQAI